MAWPGSFIPPVGDPILPRVRHGTADFDWTFGGQYEPTFVDSGTTALRLAIEVAMRHCGRRGTVWVPAYGCPDILAASCAACASPVLYDTGADRPFFAPGQQSPANLVAAVAAHFLGLVHPQDELASAIRDTGALLIEDSAQRFPMPGDEFFGDAVVLSFGRGKPVSLMGGGCLLLKRELRASGEEVVRNYPTRDLGAGVFVKCGLHDIAIRPSVFDLIRRLPGLDVGKVTYKPAPLPNVLGPRLQELVGRAANCYQAETDWTARQDSAMTRVTRRFPQLVSLPLVTNQVTRRLLRIPFLGPNAETIRQILADAVSAGVGASRLYEFVQPEISGVPIMPWGNIARSREFSRRLVTFPVSRCSDWQRTCYP